jgi:hypothetical protein
MGREPRQPRDHRGRSRVLGGVHLRRRGTQGLAGSTIRTAAWSRIGPPSTSRVTPWTVQPVTFTPRAQRLADRVQPGKARQQARVQVDDPAGKGAEEARA